CVDSLLEHGCKPEIYVGATHGVLVGKAYERLARPEIKEVVVTDTIPVPKERQNERLKVLSVAPLLAKAVMCVHENKSINSLFD
ncbi:MAG TPA: ribose-phosphate pyrophosphokinase, partial [Armatimonadetes bacterium]|nr:ribose-phosphate pyrophosphokinase [Armatimonadota bacterium]